MSESFEIIDFTMRLPVDPVYYRILTESSTTKYLVAPRHPPGSTLPSYLGRYLDFETVEVGNWTIGHLDLSEDGRFVLSSTESARLPDTGKAWHPARIDFLDLPTPLADVDVMSELQCDSHPVARVVSTPEHLGNCRKAVCFWAWQAPLAGDLGPESDIYSVIQGHDIGASLLGHITENQDRIIGFVVERLQARAANSSDLRRCQEVLARLHALDIAHGSLTRTSFLIDDSRDRAYLQNFFRSYSTTDQSVLEAELAGVENLLRPATEEAERSGPQDMPGSFSGLT